MAKASGEGKTGLNVTIRKQKKAELGLPGTKYIPHRHAPNNLPPPATL